MNLESKWLEDFSALAATRSFSQAAERRFVTQPAFSRRIRSLEAALGLTLVNRSRTPVELTAAGQLFLVTARTVVEQLGEVLRHLHHLEGGQGEVMQVAAAHSLALGFFPRWIAQLRNEGLNIATRLVATNRVAMFSPSLRSCAIQRGKNPSASECAAATCMTSPCPPSR